MNQTVPPPSELRAEIARRQISLYILAAQVGVHPGRLGQMLNGRLPLPEDLAARLTKVLSDGAHAV